MQQFDAAVTARTLKPALALERQIYDDSVCNRNDAEVRQRLLTLELDLATDRSAPPDQRAMALEEIRKPAAPLNFAATAIGLADRLFQQRRFADAQDFYDRGIALAGSDTTLSDQQKSTLVTKAGAAKILASDDDQGRAPGSYAESTRGPGGKVVGIFAPTLRGVAVVPLPLPVNFTFGSTRLTPNGEKAAAELAEVLRQQKVSSITLVGHTDPRGTAEYNLKLSLARARTIVAYLAHHDLKISIKTIGKGASEPFDASILPYRPSQDEIWTLDRRVELVW